MKGEQVDPTLDMTRAVLMPLVLTSVGKSSEE